jgi:hypothetical protein
MDTGRVSCPYFFYKTIAIAGRSTGHYTQEQAIYSQYLRDYRRLFVTGEDDKWHV